MKKIRLILGIISVSLFPVILLHSFSERFGASFSGAYRGSGAIDTFLALSLLLTGTAAIVFLRHRWAAVVAGILQIICGMAGLMITGQLRYLSFWCRTLIVLGVAILMSGLFQNSDGSYENSSEGAHGKMKKKKGEKEPPES